MLKLKRDDDQQTFPDDDAAKKSTLQIASHYRNLDASNINQLQQIYPKIVGDLKDSFVLLRQPNCSWNMARSEERRILIILSSIKPLITVKNSIFLLRGLQPSLFSLLFDILPLSDQWILTNCADSHYLLLQLAKNYARTHEQFFASSDILHSGGESQTTTQSSCSTTISHTGAGDQQQQMPISKYFANIINSIGQLLRHFHLLSNHSQFAMVDWLNQIIAIIGDQFRAISQVREIFSLRTVLLMETFFSLYLLKSPEIRKTLVKCMYRLQVFNLLQSEEIRCKELARNFSVKLCKCAGELEIEQFRALWTRIPITFLIKLFGLDGNLQEAVKVFNEKSPLSTNQTNTIVQPSLGKMQMEAYEFQLLADLLFEGKCISISTAQDDSTARNWVIVAGDSLYKSLFYSSSEEIDAENKNISPTRKEDFNKQPIHELSTLQKWLFIIGKFAQYCIFSRMKTPIGRTPLETFTKFEGELRSLASSLLTRKTASSATGKNDFMNEPLNQNDGENSLRTNEFEDEDQQSVTYSETHENSSIRSSSNVPHQLRSQEKWFRVRMLCICIDMIDKIMCYAVRGSMLKFTADIPINARQFFTINYNTCMDWLTRTTFPLMSVAFANGNYSQIIRLGGVLFAEFERKHPSASQTTPINLDSSTQNAICWVVRALVQKGASQAIHGIRTWSESMFGTSHSFEWCHFAELLASARVEEALDGFLTILQTSQFSKENVGKSTSRDHVLNAVEEMAMMAAGILRLPQAESKIRGSVKSLKRGIELDGGNKTTKQFTQIRWKRILALSSWDQITDLNDSKDNSFGEFDHIFWDVRDKLLGYEAEIQHLYNVRQQNAISNDAFRRLNTSEALYSLQDELSDFAQFLLLSGCEQTDGLEHSNIAILHALCTGIQHLSPHQHNQKFYGQQQRYKRSPTKQFGSTPVLLEFDFNDLLRNFKMNSLHRLALGQQYCGWMHRLYGGQREHSFALRKMHQDMAKLAHDLGNNQLFASHQRFANAAGMLAEGSFHSQFDILPEHHRPYAAPQIQLHQQQNGNLIQPAPPGFESMLIQQQQAVVPAHFQLPIQSPPFIHDSMESLSVPPTQTLLSEDFDGDSLRLLPNETAAMLQFGINICSEQGRHLEELIGQYSTYDEFRVHVSNAFPITDISMNSVSILTSTFPITDISMNSVSILTSIDQPSFNQLWLTIKHRQYRLYELALNSHLRFLENLFPGKSHIQTVEVILRLLKMLSRQPEWFERIVSSMPGSEAKDRHGWMDRISVEIWTGLIQQLFSYLNHPKSIVYNTVQLLLEKIGRHAPHAICFPAIVIVSEAAEKGISLSNILFGSLLTGGRRKHEDAGQGDLDPLLKLKGIDTILDVFKNTLKFEKDSESVKEEVAPRISSKTEECCKSLIRSLAISYPELVEDSMNFCHALQRIGLLYDEQWSYVLTQFDHQISRLIRSLPLPSLIDDNTQQHIQNGIADRLHIFLQKVLHSLKSLSAITCGIEPESENERQFCHTYREPIQNALDTLEQNMNVNPRLAWEPLKKLILMLNKQALKRSSLCLNVPKISAYLGNLFSTAVPIPGQEMRKFGEIVTVQSMAKLAFVLPTKTRPKKIAFTGSDGKSYTFLFKGQENLYMDTRLMQFLRICNTFFEDPKNHCQMDMDPPYDCTTYSVTPLGSRSGLIEWIDGAIPLFQIYRKWRIRQLQFHIETEGNKLQKMNTIPADSAESPASKETKNKRSGEAKNNKKTAKELEPERPMEQFYNKLKAIFAANRIPKECLSDRRNWPKELIKKVVKELIDETSKDILAKEFWMHSGTSDTWWSVTQRFARTVAVSSMLGSLIGLGDRHLDNVLVNLLTGQIVHVDYNICFGKGRTLRVPETIPFRLTGNIISALGPTKIEGTFRQSSERVLEMLRADKHVLRQLLETMKFDPLLDFSFLQSNVELRDKSQAEVIDYVVQGVHRKLMGYELKHNNATFGGGSTSPGLIKLDGGGVREQVEEVKQQKEGDWVEVGPVTVKEQVDTLVGEATNLNNLALMYEGWTADRMYRRKQRAAKTTFKSDTLQNLQNMYAALFVCPLVDPIQCPKKHPTQQRNGFNPKRTH